VEPLPPAPAPVAYGWDWFAVWTEVARLKWIVLNEGRCNKFGDVRNPAGELNPPGERAVTVWLKWVVLKEDRGAENDGAGWNAGR
jgi:hypothetical protein